VRLEFTVPQFFQQGGVSTFVHRMASLLRIHFADIRVASVYTGSTVVEFEVVSDEPFEDEEEEQSWLDGVAATFEETMSTITEFMGTPVLNAVSGG
jgi:hypothetical protein